MTTSIDSNNFWLHQLSKEQPRIAIANTCSRGEWRMALTSLSRDILIVSTIQFQMVKFVPSSCFLNHGRIKAVASHLTPFIVSVHPPPMHLLTSNLRLVCWSTLKIAKDFTLHFIMHLLLFFACDWLISRHMIISHICSLCFLFILRIAETIVKLSSDTLCIRLSCTQVEPVGTMQILVQFWIRLSCKHV